MPTGATPPVTNTPALKQIRQLRESEGNLRKGEFYRNGRVEIINSKIEILFNITGSGNCPLMARCFLRVCECMLSLFSAEVTHAWTARPAIPCGLLLRSGDAVHMRSGGCCHSRWLYSSLLDRWAHSKITGKQREEAVHEFEASLICVASSWLPMVTQLSSASKKKKQKQNKPKSPNSH